MIHKPFVAVVLLAAIGLPPGFAKADDALGGYSRWDSQPVRLVEADRYYEGRFRRSVPQELPQELPEAIEIAPRRPKIITPHGFPAPYRLPGEFENQDALLVACRELVHDMPELFKAIIRETHGNVAILALTPDREHYEEAMRLLQQNRIPHDHVRFVEVEHDTMWARDYGPAIARQFDGRAIVIDAGYAADRANDDYAPVALAQQFRLPVASAPARIDGGNLLTNGAGLVLTTHRLMDENAFQGLDEEAICEVLRRSYGFRQIVMLEPLMGEPTGHVDMFATFTSVDTVVVGAYDAQVDGENAALLDRNVAILSQVRTSRGALRVVRIAMPPRHDGAWRTYANVVYANGVLLAPIYPTCDAPGRAHALATFSRLLPNRRVVGIDADAIAQLEGALHCVTMNLGPIGPLPRFPAPRRRTTRLRAIQFRTTQFRTGFMQAVAP